MVAVVSRAHFAARPMSCHFFDIRRDPKGAASGRSISLYRLYRWRIVHIAAKDRRARTAVGVSVRRSVL